jgi:hypothetical protein
MENECAFMTFTDASYAIAYSRYEGLVVEGEFKKHTMNICFVEKITFSKELAYPFPILVYDLMNMKGDSCL